MAYFIFVRSNRPSTFSLGYGRCSASKARCCSRLAGLDLTTDEGVFTACRRYQAHLAARGAARKREAEEREAAKKAPARCSFCREPTSSDRMMVGDGVHFICESCVTEAASAIATHKRSATESREQLERTDAGRRAMRHRLK